MPSPVDDDALRAQATDELRARVAERIRALSKRRKVSRDALAASAGISRAMLFSVLGGKTPATTDTLAYALRVDPIELVRGPPRGKRPPAGDD
ncbi:MAG: helix-turn-helix transcriptional regulator [Nannocystaceae bacterium]